MVRKADSSEKKEGKGRRQMLSESVSKLLGGLIEIGRPTLTLHRLWPRSEIECRKHE